MSILVSIPNIGEIKTELVKFLMRIDKRDDVEVHFSNARPVDVNRNKIANYFLEETDHEWLLMVDDDIIPPDNILDMVEEHDDKYIMSAIVFSISGGIPYPVATEFKENQPGEQLRKSTGAENEKALKVDATGTGCIFIRREVIEEMEHPYFEFTKGDDGTLKEGEDITFCLNARELGYQPWMITDYVCGHLQNMNYKNLMKMLHLAIETNKSEIYFEETGGSNEYEDKE